VSSLPTALGVWFVVRCGMLSGAWRLGFQKGERFVGARFGDL
jgi:hypothetical protein